MSRDESDREELLREATALVERIELTIPALTSEPIVIGFRRTGCLSLFISVDPVIQFNSQGELRRLYCGGELLKAEKRCLVALRRERTPAATLLVRRELSADEQQDLLRRIEQQVTLLLQALQTNDFQLTGQVPADQDVLGRVVHWLSQNRPPWKLAVTPHAK